MQLIPRNIDDAQWQFPIFAAVYRSRYEQWGLGDRETEQIMQLQHRSKVMSYRSQYPDADYYAVRMEERDVCLVTVHHGQSFITLVDLAVIPEFQQRGIGTQIVRELQSSARRSDIPLKLRVDIENRTAADWYIRMGFFETVSSNTHQEMVWSHKNQPNEEEGQS